MVPEAAEVEQFPGSESRMGGGVVQVVAKALQVPVVDQVPELHVAFIIIPRLFFSNLPERVPVKPDLQTGTQEVPEAAGEEQFPASESRMGGRVAQDAAQAPVVAHVPELHVAKAAIRQSR